MDLSESYILKIYINNILCTKISVIASIVQYQFFLIRGLNKFYMLQLFGLALKSLLIWGFSLHLFLLVSL